MVGRLADHLGLFSESFESLSQVFQEAMWELAGVPLLYRTDKLSTAINGHFDKATSLDGIAPCGPTLV